MIECKLKEVCEFYLKKHSCDSMHKLCAKRLAWIEDRKKEDPRFEYFNKRKFNFAGKFIKCNCAECNQKALHCRELFYNQSIYLCTDCANKWADKESLISQDSDKKYSSLIKNIVSLEK